MNDSVTVSSEIDVHRLFDDLSLRYARRPLYRIAFDLDQAAMERLAERFADRIYRSLRRLTPDGLQLVTVVLRFDEDTFAMASTHYSPWGEVYACTAERADAVFRELEPVVNAVTAEPRAAFYMLRYDGSEISAQPITDVPVRMSDDVLRLFYGPDVADWLQHFDAHTRARIGGITIFEGPPGTGKTTLIAQLVARLAASHVFYVLPVGNDAALTTPELVPFWVSQGRQHPDKVKVIVMEDAERVLLRRDAENQNSISSLLNIADGLMGRMLRLHVVCSLNGRLEEIDPAILRPGRLRSYRQFRLLSRENAAAVAAASGVPFAPNRDRQFYSLAEILNPAADPASSSPPVRIGFN